MSKFKKAFLGLFTLVMVFACTLVYANGKSEKEVFPATTTLTTGTFDGAKNVHYTDSGLVAYCLNRWLAAPSETGELTEGSSIPVVKRLDYIRKGKFDGSTTYKTTIYSPSWNSGVANNANKWFDIEIRPEEQYMYLTIALNGYPYKTKFGDTTLTKTEAFEATQYAMWAVAYNPPVEDWNETESTYEAIRNWHEQKTNKNVYKAAWWLYSYAKEHASSKIVNDLDAYLYVPNSLSSVEMVGGFTKPQSYQRFFVIHPHDPKPKSGKVKLAKISSNEKLTKNNASYDLSNAYFHIYKGDFFFSSKDTGKWFKTTTQKEENGHVVSYGVDFDHPENDFISLEPGTYWVREEYAPSWQLPTTKSYTMPEEKQGTVSGDVNGRVSKPYKVIVQSDKTVWVDDDSDTLNGYVTNIPASDPIAIGVNKHDAQGGEGKVANGAASVAGAEFTIRYYDNITGDTTGSPKRSWVIKTNQRGRAALNKNYLVSGDEFYTTPGGFVTMPYGTVTIQETKAPKGYLLEGQTANSPEGYQAPIHKHIINKSTTNNNLNISLDTSIPEPVIRGGVAVQKLDAANAPKTTSSFGSFEGATFDVINENEQAVVVSGKSYNKGDKILTLTTDKSGYAKTDSNVLPYGKYSLKETKAPEGYMINYEKRPFTISELSEVVKVSVEDSPIKAGIKVVKQDAQTTTEQGTATFKGVQFAISNAQSKSVYVNGKEYKSGAVITTITTDKTGVAQTTSDALPYGVYKVTEIKAPVGYTLNSSWSQTVDLKEAGKLYVTTCKDEVIRGGVQIFKKDLDFDTFNNTGLAKLEGATFEVISDNDNLIMVNGNSYKKGQVVATVVANREDNVVVARTGSILPFGNYIVKEVATGTGYSLNSKFVGHASIDSAPKDKGYIVDVTCKNPIQRFDWSFVKVSEDTKKPMAGVPFKITSTTTGEYHVIISDENGVVDTSAKHAKHTYKTNHNDSLVGKDGWINDKLKDAHAGIWFSGSKDTTVDPNDNLGALPFDTYLVEELRSDANYGHALTGFVYTTTEGEVNRNLGNVDNKVINVTSELTSELTKDHILPGQKQVTLLDKVNYTNLVAGSTYTVEGTLHILDETGKDLGVLKNADGSPYTVKKDFTTEMPFGSVTQTFVVDADTLLNKKVVAFEKIYEKSHEIAKHEDITDLMQTVAVPKITTKAHGEDGSHYLSSVSNTKIIDTVSYTNLLVGKSYTLKAELYIQGEDKPRDTTSVGFIADKAEGQQDVTFMIDSSNLQGKSAYIFETLVYNNHEIAWHKDAKDLNQTVHFAQLTSELANKQTGKTIPLDEKAELTDTLTYHNLDTNSEYKVVGTLHGRDADGNDLGVLADDEGKEINAESTFKPAQAEGTQAVTFTFNSTKLDKKVVALVAYQSLYKGDKLVAEHGDIANADQTAYVPGMTTELVNAQDKTHKIARGDVQVIDTINYSGLVKGQTYTVKSYLHLKAKDGSDGGLYNKQVVENKFVAEDVNGQTSILFEFNSEDLDKDTLVAYEEIYQGDVLIATECDINNADQSVVSDGRPPKPPVKTADKISTLWLAILTSSIWLFFIVGLLHIEKYSAHIKSAMKHIFRR